MGKVNNQNFVQIPFLKLRKIIGYLAERNGIRVIEQEESYTSKASFVDNDFIPVYGSPEATACSFSGKRAPSGFRGLYKTNDEQVINSDLNGSANIGRKAFPEIFHRDTAVLAFSDVEVIVHPDMDYDKVNRAKQLATPKVPSKSSVRRAHRRSLRKCSPSGVVLCG